MTCERKIMRDEKRMKAQILLNGQMIRFDNFTMEILNGILFISVLVVDVSSRQLKALADWFAEKYPNQTIIAIVSQNSKV
jgi:hypothetical protein